MTGSAVVRVSAACAVGTALLYAKPWLTGTSSTFIVPPQSVLVKPHTFSVIGRDGHYRADAFEPFNPTNTSPPFFQIFDRSFLSVIGPSPSIVRISSNPGLAFAHEAPVWLPDTDELVFASNAGGALGFSDWDNNNQVAKINMRAVEAALSAAAEGRTVNIPATKLDLPDSVQMTNGGTGPYHGQLLLANSGRARLPSTIALVDPSPPHVVTVLLDNFFGRPFNSLNDVKIHRQSGLIFFTDAPYGYLNHFRPLPALPNQVYVFDPVTRALRVVAEGVDKCNGIAFSEDGRTAYISDTGMVSGFQGEDPMAPATIYAFDIDSKTHAFTNRRVFAYVDNGVPDGLQVDAAGNVYSGCGDGVQVWNRKGVLIGKIFLNTTSANMAFAGPGRLILLAETDVYLARIHANGLDLAYP